MTVKTWGYVICEDDGGGASFRGPYWLEAADEESAYDAAHALVPQPKNGAGINDFAFEATPPEGAEVLR